VEAFVAEADGQIIGTGCGIRYGGSTGWVGMISVLPDQRGCGTGRAITEACVESLRRRGAAGVVLSASLLGRPVYERIGFKAGPTHLVLKGEPLAAPSADPRIRPLRPQDWDAVCALDREATGEDRSAFLAQMPSGWVVDGSPALRGFLIKSPWGVGPTIAVDAEAGMLLLGLASSLSGPGALRFSVPEPNRAAVSALIAAGFREDRRNTYMVLGEQTWVYRPQHIWTMFSFALG
jgi:predicted N-acetyltransferase YhbS